jgi:hypothetical protein
MRYFTKSFMAAACGLLAIGMTGCEQSATSREQARIEQNAAAQREAVDRKLEAQKDAAKELKEDITAREKNMVNSVEQDAKIRERDAAAQQDAAHREAAAAQDRADRAKERADQVDNQAKQVNQ